MRLSAAQPIAAPVCGVSRLGVPAQRNEVREEMLHGG